MSETDWDAALIFLQSLVDNGRFKADASLCKSRADYVEKLAMLFDEQTKIVIDKFVPKSKSKSPRDDRSKEWFNKKCLIADTKTKKAYDNWKSTNSKADWDVYQACLKVKSATIKAAKESHIDLVSEKIANCDDAKEWWKKVNDILDNKSRPQIPALVKDGEVYTDDIAKANLLNNCYVKQTCLDAPDDHLQKVVAESPRPEAGNPWEVPLSNIKVRKRTVLRILKRLKTGKATGSDGIPAVFLKRAADILAGPLTHLFRHSIQCGYFPQIWKYADVVALYKKNNVSDPVNYRPVSLLPIVSKVFEKVVSIKIKKSFMPLFNQRQFGFRPGRTSLDLLINMVQNWTDALASGSEVRAVALDISKAFDKVWHDGLLWKLEHKFGVTGPLLKWFRSYLTGRKQRVVINDVFSDLKAILAGVPQGSVLGPILFLVFINDLFDSVNNNLDVFADDSTLWAVVPLAKTDKPAQVAAKRARVAESLNADLRAIESWARKWLVTYNDTKTELVTISTKRDMSAFRKNALHKKGYFLTDPTPCPHPPLFFYGTAIPERPKVKIVGVTLTYNMSWSDHVNGVISKAKRSIYLLRRAATVLNPVSRLVIYKSHIRSQMEYCCPLWMGADTVLLRKLDAIQSKAVRIIGVKSVCVNLQSLGHRRSVAALCVMHRLVQKIAPQALHPLIPPYARVNPYATRARLKSIASSVSVSASDDQMLFRRPAADKRFNLRYWSSSCIPMLTDMWNSLPSHVRKLEKPVKFKREVNNLSHARSLSHVAIR